MESPTLQHAEQVLKKYWGYERFRPGQAGAIQSVLDGRQTLVLFPTGGGKSLCYQVPAMVLDRLTIVISPLVALMQDQVDQLKKLGIRATFINSTLPGYEVEQRLVNARNGMYKMLYIAPERLASERWKIEQPQLNIGLIAVDEAHCISEWGHDFRPSYRQIRKELDGLAEDVRWIALTATATPEVRDDLLKNLGFNDPSIITGGFKRPNLHWWVKKTDKKQEFFLKSVTKGAKLGSGIVYTNTRKACDEWALFFTKRGIPSKPYHAGMITADREKVQNEWVGGEIPLVIATNAFGMGIDKADCRFVIHHTLPFSLESYYQEAGRAGRDGKISYPLLIFKESDVNLLKSRINRSYPEYETLQKVYDGLCDELGLAVGSRHETPEAVDYSRVAKRIGLPESVLASAFEVLQRLQILELTELYGSRVGVHIIVSPEYLRNFIEQADPGKGDFLDTFYRQYGPSAFKDFHYLETSYLQKKLNVTENQLRKALRVFSHHDQILKTSWLGERPLVKMMDARMSKLQIDHHKAYHYRDVLFKKLDYMARYATTSECRDVFLRNYFGEADAEACGQCDNCKNQKQRKQEPVKEQDVRLIKEFLQEKEKSIEEMLSHTRWNRKKLQSVVQYMEREQLIIQVEEEGKLYRTKNSKS